MIPLTKTEGRANNQVCWWISMFLLPLMRMLAIIMTKREAPKKKKRKLSKQVKLLFCYRIYFSKIWLNKLLTILPPPTPTVDIAVKAAEKKAFSNMKKVKGTETVRKMRKRMWFEKFLWFISSDGLVVVGGRDAQQNEVSEGEE